MVAGVCGGIAEYLGTDPTAIRLLYVLVMILTGLVPLILAYLLLWIIIPEHP